MPAVLSALTAARSAVRDASLAAVWSLHDDELATAAAQTQALAAQVNGVLSQVLAETDGRDLAGRLGAPTTAAWLRDTQRMTPQAAAGAVRQAVALHGSGGRIGQPAARVAEAMAAGTLLADQAHAIVDVLADAPASATAAVKSAAEQRLVSDAADLDAVGLRRLGSYIWQVVDPAAADAAETARLEAAEQRAHDQRRLALTPVGDGMTRITGRLPDLSAALVRTPSTRWRRRCRRRSTGPTRVVTASAWPTPWSSWCAARSPAAPCPTAGVRSRGWSSRCRTPRCCPTPIPRHPYSHPRG